MSVLGRKMFKDPSNRGARNMLKGMGGIMSSSPELANAVQGYGDGGGIEIPGNTNTSTVIPDALKWLRSKLKIFPSDNYEPDLSDIESPEITHDLLKTVVPNYNYTDEMIESMSQDGFEAVPIFKEGSFIGWDSRPIEGSGIAEVVPDFTKTVVTDELMEKRDRVLEEVVKNLGFGGKNLNFITKDMTSTNIWKRLLAGVPEAGVKLTKKALNLLAAIGDIEDPRIISGLKDGTFTLPEGMEIADLRGLQDETMGRPEWAKSSGITQLVTEEKPEDADVVGRYDEEGFRRRPAEELLFQGADKPTTDQPSIQQRLREIEKMKAGAGKGPGLPEEMTEEFMRRPYDPDDKLKELQQQAFEDYKLELQQEEARRVALKAGAGKGPGANLTDGPPRTGADADADADASSAASVEGQTAEEIAQTGTAANITKEVTDNLPASVFGDTDQEKSSSLEELMTQYKSKSPKFEGLDKGMAIAKIGFAMAAGQSPNALTNIANAFSMGADMFIEDKKERDAFQRQVDLTALQYGMGELSKERAQARADKRDIRDFIVNKPGTYFGREYKKYEPITLTMQELISLGPDAIRNFSSLEAFTERQDAMAETIGSNLFPYGSLKMSELKDSFKEYKDNLVAAKDSEYALIALNDALLDTANKDLVSSWAAGKEAYGKILRATFGDDGSDKFNDLATFERKLGIALNAIIPSLIGDTQSANSISDRDVGFIISAFLSEGLIKRDNDGNYFLVKGSTAFLGQSQEAMARGLKAASDRIQIAQRTNLADMLQFEETVGLLGIEGTTMTGATFLSRSIKERKLLTEGAGSGSSLLYYWDPKAGGVKLAGQEA